jgi:hypothetical protein
MPDQIIVAALQFGTALIELIKADRELMDTAQRKRLDEVRIAGLERVERILSLMEGRK